MKRALCVFLAAACSLVLVGFCNADAAPLPASSGTERAADALPESAALTEKNTAPSDEALVRVLDFLPSVRQALAYATADTFSDHPLYDFTDAYLRYGTVKKLQQVCEELAAQGLGLKIWDGFRPLGAQEELNGLYPAFLSGEDLSDHNRGGAVDLTLVDLETGEELPLPTGYNNFTAYADRDYSDCSPEAAANAQLLEDVMKKHGFDPSSLRWWHFNDTQEYPVAESFLPGIPTLWRSGKGSAELLRSPGGSHAASIGPGETMELLGWEGKYALVRCGGREGYVLSSDILPASGDFSDYFCIVSPTACYSYEQLLADLKEFEERWPGDVTVDSIGLTELGQKIPILRIGEQDAKYHVLLQGAIHGREHATAWLLMALADYWLDHGILNYGDICFHIIPMTNPDGVAISQTGELTESQQEIYQSDRQHYSASSDQAEYTARWKANGEGVDLNRNFPAGWEEIDGRSRPSSHLYEGDAPFSAAETAALRDYTLRYDFDVTVSYHATGSLLYAEYGGRQDVNALSRSLGEAVSEVTGYPLTGNGESCAGYKDWAIDALGIPSLTIEVGCHSAPLAEEELASVFFRNLRVLPAIARWLQRS